jgi:hypothetical protein
MQSDQENNDEEKSRETIDCLVSKTENIHQKMQLWSNAYENEYALRLELVTSHYAHKLEDSFLERTGPNSKYTHIVVESDYLEDFKDGADYTLTSRTIQRSTTTKTKRRILEGK